MVVGRLMVFALRFGPEDLGLSPDATKDPQSICGVRACKIRCSESFHVGHCQFFMGVVSGENIPPLSETNQNCGSGDGCCFHLLSRGRNQIPAIAKWASHLSSNVLICLKLYMALGLPSGT